MAIRPDVLDAKIAILDRALLAKALREGGERKLECAAGAAAKDTDDRLRRLLRPRHQRPRRRAAEQGDEFAPPDHSITSSASANKEGGIVSPSAVAVLRLMTRLN